MIDFEKAIEIFNYRFAIGIPMQACSCDTTITKYEKEILQTQELVNIALNYTDIYHWKSWVDSVPNKKGVKYALILKGDTEPSVVADRILYNNTLVFTNPLTHDIYCDEDIVAWFELPKYKNQNEES